MNENNWILMVCGSRDVLREKLTDVPLWDYATSADLIIHGACPNSPDMWASEICKEMNIPVKEYPADWNAYGKSAGHIRNRKMVDDADFVLCFWDGKSNGTGGVIKYCIEKKKDFQVAFVKGKPPEEEVKG